MERIAFPRSSQADGSPPKTENTAAGRPILNASNAPLMRPRFIVSWNNGFSSLTENEWRRRLLHMLPGFLPFLWIVLPHASSSILLWQWSLLALTVVYVCVACYFGCAFAREGESNCHWSTISYGAISILPVLLLPTHPEISAAALTVLALGDGSAALGGLLLGGAMLPWNRHKSWAGFLSFLIGSIPLGTFYFWYDIEPAVSWSSAILCVGIAGLAGAIIESIPSKINDNLRVGSVAILALLLSKALLIG